MICTGDKLYVSEVLGHALTTSSGRSYRYDWEQQYYRTSKLWEHMLYELDFTSSEKCSRPMVHSEWAIGHSKCIYFHHVIDDKL